MHGQVTGPIPARTARRIQTIVPVNLDQDGWNKAGTAADLAPARSRPPAPNGMTVHITGPPGNAADSSEAFEGIDGTLLLRHADRW